MRSLSRILLAFVLVFAVASVSLAGKAGQGSLNGTFVGTGSGSGIFAFCGFDDQNIPVNASLGYYEVMTVNTQSKWTFRPDGTGSVEALSQVMSLPNTVIEAFPGFDGLRFPWAGESTITGEFSYEFDQLTGQIHIAATKITTNWISGPLAGQGSDLTVDVNPLATLSGVVSQDRKSIKLNASGIPRSIGLTIPLCGAEPQDAAIIMHLSTIALRQDKAPDLLR